MKKKEVKKFEKIQAQILEINKEILTLSEKNPEDSPSKFKLQFINSVLFEANNVLTDKYIPVRGFECFNEDQTPTYSDMKLVISQYLSCMDRFRADNIKKDKDDIWDWLGWLIDW